MTTEEVALFSLNESAASKHKFSMRRSYLEIRMDILSCVKAGAEKPTQIMYKANLSWTALKEHLAALLDGNLLAAVEVGSRTKYELTDKAMGVLMAYNKMVEDVTAPPQKAAPSASF